MATPIIDRLEALINALEYRLPSSLYADGSTAAADGVLLETNTDTPGDVKTGAFYTLGTASGTTDATAAQLRAHLTAVKGAFGTALTTTSQKQALSEYISAVETELAQVAGGIENTQIDSISAAKITSGTFDGTRISDDAIDSQHLAAGAVDATALGADAVNGDKIADGSIDSEHFAAGAVDATALGADAVNGDKIADDSIDSEHLVDGSIDSAHFAAGAVDTTALGADAVNGDKIADDSIDSEHLVDGSIDTAHLANDAVTGDKIADNTIDEVHLSFSVLADGSFGHADDEDIADHLGDAPIAGVSVTDSLGASALSTKFARDTAADDITAAKIQSSLKAVLSPDHTYADSTEMATQMLNAIGGTIAGSEVTVEILKEEIDAITGQAGTGAALLNNKKAALYTAVVGATGSTDAALKADLAADLAGALNGTPVSSNDISNAELVTEFESAMGTASGSGVLKPVSLSSAIGYGDLTTTAKTLVGGINELDDEIGATDISGVGSGPLNDSITGIIGTTALTTAAQSLSGGISELDAEIGDITGTSGLLSTASTIAGAIGTGVALSGDFTATTIVGALNELKDADQVADTTTGTFYACLDGESTNDAADIAGATSSAVMLERMVECSTWANSGGDIGYATTNGGSCTDVTSIGDALSLCMGTILSATTYGDAV